MPLNNIKKFNSFSNVQHVGIIMDGNRRWAKSKGFKVLKQYKKTKTNINQPLADQSDEEIGIQIPEITFPNIFKALVVFYR